MANSPALAIGDFSVRQLNGLFSLNDLHAAAGGEAKQRPNYFLDLQQTKELTAEIEKAGIPAISAKPKVGTYACRELVIAYAAWISAAFHLKVIRVFLAATTPTIPATITPAQAQHLKELVQIVVESGKQSYGETYARLQRKFHVNSYLALTPAQFEPACEYLSGKVDGPGMAAIVQKHFPQITLTKDPSMPEPTRTLDVQAVANAIDAATAIGAQVQKAVVHAILSGSTSFMNDRWMVSFVPDARHGRQVMVNTVGQDDVVASLPVLASMIAEPGGFMPSTEELAALGSACMSRLSQRLPMRKAA